MKVKNKIEKCFSLVILENIRLIISLYIKLIRKEFIPMKVLENDTIYTILRSVSRSGMTRYIDAYIIRDNKPECISFEIANGLGWKLQRADKGSGIKVEGCGMDMGFHLIYSYAQLLIKDGYKLHQQWL
jgi:hypothetical protein